MINWHHPPFVGQTTEAEGLTEMQANSGDGPVLELWASNFQPWLRRPLQSPTADVVVETSKKLNAVGAADVGAGAVNYSWRRKLQPPFQEEEQQSSRLGQSPAWRVEPRSLQQQRWDPRKRKRR